MSDSTPVGLVPSLVALDAREFDAICSWSFDDSYVSRLLQGDIRNRMHYGLCRVWIYLDPDGQIVGFGTIDVRDLYADYTGGLKHFYIPLLAVKPGMEGRRLRQKDRRASDLSGYPNSTAEEVANVIGAST